MARLFNEMIFEATAMPECFSKGSRYLLHKENSKNDRPITTLSTSYQMLNFVLIEKKLEEHNISPYE